MNERLNALPVSNEIKSYLIGKDNVFADKHKFYINLTKFYSPAFPVSSAIELDTLIDGSYLYFRSLLLADSIFDDPHTNKDKLLLLLPIFEEAVKKLAYIFPERHKFWIKFYQAKQEYFESILNERRLTLDGQITSKVFVTIAIAKSSVCYSILDALNDISDNQIDTLALKKSLEDIHIGFQYLDDIDDFKEDLERGQRTYAHSMVEGELKDKHGNVEMDNENKHKYLFISGIAESLILKACNHFTQALSVARQYNLKDLENFLQSEITQCQSQVYEINLLIEKTKIKAKKSYTVIQK